MAHWWFGRKDGIKETVGFTEGVRDGCWVGEGLGLWLGDGDGYVCSVLEEYDDERIKIGMRNFSRIIIEEEYMQKSAYIRRWFVARLA